MTNLHQITKQIKVPTGDICIMQGDKGLIEFLSIGDYGKEKNIKADFLGLTKDINGVPNGDIMPLTEKWVITISSQYGCSIGCTFCDVPKVGQGHNATAKDMLSQIKLALGLHPDIIGTDRLNIHFARMGEPTFNRNVLDVAATLKRHIYDFWGNSKTVHPVVSTMMPNNNKRLISFLKIWTEDVKNGLYHGEAGLQFSINSTSDIQRNEMFNNNALSLSTISRIGKMLVKPLGRKYTLNFALADNYELDAKKLVKLFDPNKFIIKITPMHDTNACQDNDIQTSGGYEYFTPYKPIEKELKEVGFDVLVFIPSIEEDESRITCGNAILADDE